MSFLDILLHLCYKVLETCMIYVFLFAYLKPTNVKCGKCSSPLNSTVVLYKKNNTFHKNAIYVIIDNMTRNRKT